MVYGKIEPELERLMRGGLNEKGGRNEKLLSQLSLSFERSLFFAPDFEKYAKLFRIIAEAFAELKAREPGEFSFLVMPDRVTLAKLADCNFGVSLDTISRLYLCCKAIYKYEGAAELWPAAFAAVSRLFAEGEPANIIEASLYVGDSFAINEFRKKLVEKGVANIGSLADFSAVVFEHVDITPYEHDCREHILQWVATNDYATQMQHRVTEHVVREFMVGLRRLAKPFGIRVPSQDTFFKCSAKSGKANGKSTVALPRRNGNLVPRVAVT